MTNRSDPAPNFKSTILPYTPLASPLEPLEPFIRTLITLLTEEHKTPSRDVEIRILESIRSASSAESVYALKRQKNDWIIRSFTPQNSPNHSSEALTEILATLPAYLPAKDPWTPIPGSAHTSRQTKTSTDHIVVIPLTMAASVELLVVIGLPSGSPLLAESFSQIIEATYDASNRFTSIQPERMEAAILDRLKSFYTFVPLTLYNRRFELFWTQLQRMDVRFQPIIRLSRDNPYVFAFEALALDPDQNRAPAELFAAAEQWGVKFLLELDMYFLRRATNKYRQLHLKTRGRQRPEDMLDLSVNVYPDSLLRTAYYETVRDITEKETVLHDKLILEISEKFPLPTPQIGDGINDHAGPTTFRQILEKYVRDIKIGFAIDDFGVGHSSVSRLAELHPGYIKIDRELLLHDSARDTISFVYGFITHLVSQRHLRPARVVLEGYDAAIAEKVPLSQLYMLGIRYLQGYIIGKPGDGLTRLDDAKKSYLKALVNGET